jgi:hypothetical protein
MAAVRPGSASSGVGIVDFVNQAMTSGYDSNQPMTTAEDEFRNL